MELTPQQQSNKATLKVLHYAIQSILTRVSRVSEIGAFTFNPETVKEFDETTNAIIFERLRDKLLKRGN